ncbi:MAG: hypothetical protein JWP81_4431 [Ferruginibacter sp.]|nr:hypothetical protein [Ferruginibacter sp.]
MLVVEFTAFDAPTLLFLVGWFKKNINKLVYME